MSVLKIESNKSFSCYLTEGFPQCHQENKKSLVTDIISDYYRTHTWSLAHRYLDENLFNQQMLDETFCAISTHFGGQTDEILQRLVDKGADVNARNSFALNYACYCGLLPESLEQRVGFLLDCGADPKQSDRPLLVRVAAHSNVLKRFLELGVDPNQRGIVSDAAGSVGPLDALTFAICRFRSHNIGIGEEQILESVQILVEAGANIHRKSLGKTPLEHAKEQGLQTVVDYLASIRQL